MVLQNFPALSSGKNRTLIKPFWDGLIIPVDQPGTMQPQEVSTSINFKGLSPVFEKMKSYSTESSSSLIFPKLCSTFSNEIKGSEFRNENAKINRMNTLIFFRQTFFINSNFHQFSRILKSA